MSSFSTFLFAEPSFLEGMARILDVGGVLNVYNSSQTGKQADFWATYADWRAVGQEIQNAAMAECSRVLLEGGNVRRPARPTRKP